MINCNLANTHKLLENFIHVSSVKDILFVEEARIQESLQAAQNEEQAKAESEERLRLENEVIF